MSDKQAVRLIAIDMDGTLLDATKSIPEDNIKAIQEAIAAGIKIVLCTGRPKSGILPYFEQLGLTDEEFIIMNNGCSTYETKGWRLLNHATLTWEDVDLLEKACRDFPDVYLTLTGEKNYYVVADAVPELVAYDAGTVFTEAKAASLSQIKAEGEIIFQAMFMGEAPVLDQFQLAKEAELGQFYSTVRSQDYIFEIMPEGITKASALEQLAGQLQVPLEQVMALGDAANDLEMLTLVGHSVAMGNASDVIKALCRYVTLDNNKAGVAYAIRSWALKDSAKEAVLKP